MVKRGSNIDFIVTFIGEEKYVTSSRARRALCKNNGKVFHRGYYCCYFWDGGVFCKERGFQNTHKFWTRIQELVSAHGEKKVYRTAFCLTPLGMERFIELEGK